MQKLNLKQKLTGKLTFQQINYIKLLQVSSCDMTSRIAKEIEDNPVLEQSENSSEINTEDSSYNINNNNSKVNYSNYNDINYKNIPFSQTFREKLMQQLEFLGLKGNDYKIGKHIIGSIDADGYLRTSLDDIIDEFAFNYYIEINPKQVEKMVKLIQTFDPIGVGARNLRECLELQLNKLNNDILNVDQNVSKTDLFPKEKTDYQNIPKWKQYKEEVKLSKLVIKECFLDFANKHYDKIVEKLNLSNKNSLKPVINIIKNLNPKPGRAFASNSNNNTFIYPDFIITRRDDNLIISLSKDNIPNLRINKNYGDLSKKSSSNNDANIFLKKKLNSAKWFIDAIKQRQATMLKTMNAIVKLQKNYFKDDEECNLKPLILKDVANEIKMDVSTISRVVSNKYVQTDYGIHPLKFFFSESIKTKDGNEVSSREVKDVINNIIINENKKSPYTDEQITNLLNKKGYKIARRTVSKYREQLKLPVTRLRKGL